MSLLLLFPLGGGSGIIDGYQFVVEPEYTTFIVGDTVEVKRVYLEKDAKKQIVMDWTDWLNGSTISSVTWTASNTAATVSDESNTNTVATCYVSAGSWGKQYTLQCQIVTGDTVSRTESRTIQLYVQRMTDL